MFRRLVTTCLVFLGFLAGRALRADDVFTPQELDRQVRLLLKLRSPEFEVRSRAAVLFGKIANQHLIGRGKGVHPAIMILLRLTVSDADRNSREGAAQALGEIGLLDSETAGMLRSRLEGDTERDYFAKRHVQIALEKHVKESDLLKREERVFFQLANEPPDKRKISSGVFLKYPRREIVSQLKDLDALASPDLEIRIAAAERIGKRARDKSWGEAVGNHPGLMAVLRDRLASARIEAVREGAANAFGQIVVLDVASLQLLQRMDQRLLDEQNHLARDVKWRQWKKIEGDETDKVVKQLASVGALFRSVRQGLMEYKREHPWFMTDIWFSIVDSLRGLEKEKPGCTKGIGPIVQRAILDYERTHPGFLVTFQKHDRTLQLLRNACRSFPELWEALHAYDHENPGPFRVLVEGEEFNPGFLETLARTGDGFRGLARTLVEARRQRLNFVAALIRYREEHPEIEAALRARPCRERLSFVAAG